MIDFDLALAKTKGIKMGDVKLKVNGKEYNWSEKNIMIDLKIQQMYRQAMDKYGPEEDWPVEFRWEFWKDSFYLKFGKEEVESWWTIEDFDDYSFMALVTELASETMRVQKEFFDKLTELPLEESPAEQKAQTKANPRKKK